MNVFWVNLTDVLAKKEALTVILYGSDTLQQRHEYEPLL